MLAGRVPGGDRRGFGYQFFGRTCWTAKPEPPNFKAGDAHRFPTVTPPVVVTVFLVLEQAAIRPVLLSAQVGLLAIGCRNGKWSSNIN